MMIGIEFKDVTSEDVAFSKIVTKPDNPYFRTGDVAIVKRTYDWSDIKDGDFVLIENDEGVMEGFDDSLFKASFKKENVILSPLSSFVPYKERGVAFGNLEDITLNGKLLGMMRGLSNEILLDKFRLYPEEERE